MAIRNVLTRGYGAGASIPFVVTRGYSSSLGATATVGGATALTEPLIFAGAQVLTITLANDTWLAAGTPFNQIRQIILNGLTSAQSEQTGWNKEVRDKESIVSVVRTSSTVVTITLTAAPDYDITVNETITVTVPKEALTTSTSDLVSSVTIGVTATAPIIAAHSIDFTSSAFQIVFVSAARSTSFESVSNATIGIQAEITDDVRFLLLEDGGRLLLESGGKIVLEKA